MFDRKNSNSQNVISIENLVDFTLLDPRATEADLEKLCNIAYKHSYYSVCVNSANVSFVKGYIDKNLNGELKVVSVVGFPLGASLTSVKCFETKEAIACGADEIDFVVNIGKIKQGKFDYVKNELKKIKSISKKHIVKAIVETCYLDKNEIIIICKICAQTKIDYVKTSTGFGIGGARVDDVKLMYDSVKGCCKIKASGGIASREQAIELVNAGASRIGTSHII